MPRATNVQATLTPETCISWFSHPDLNQNNNAFLLGNTAQISTWNTLLNGCKSQLYPYFTYTDNDTQESVQYIHIAPTPVETITNDINFMGRKTEEIQEVTEENKLLLRKFLSSCIITAYSWDRMDVRTIYFELYNIIYGKLKRLWPNISTSVVHPANVRLLGNNRVANRRSRRSPIDTQIPITAQTPTTPITAQTPTTPRNPQTSRTPRTAQTSLGQTSPPPLPRQRMPSVDRVGEPTVRRMLTYETTQCDAENVECGNLLNTLAHDKDIIQEIRHFANSLLCDCSWLRTKISKKAIIKNTILTLDKDLTNQDISDIQVAHAFYNKRKEYVYFDSSTKNFAQLIHQKIQDLPTSEDECEKQKVHSYVSQLFEKVSKTLYTPLPQLSPENKTLDFYEQLDYNEGIYSRYKPFFHNIVTGTSQKRKITYGKQVFGTYIGSDVDPNVVIRFHNGKHITLEMGAGPVRQFFREIFQELIEINIFTSIETPFGTKRYVINKTLDLEKIECIRNYLNSQREIFVNNPPTPEIAALTNEEKGKTFNKTVKPSLLKTTIIPDFYRYIGNLIHFAVTNNIELPFHISRVYLMMLFSIGYDTGKYSIQGENNIIPYPRFFTDRRLVISTYLIENEGFFKRIIYPILQNPELLNPTSDKEKIDEYGMFDIHNPGLRMNSLNIIKKDAEDIFLYNENISILLDNLENFIYLNALSDYTGYDEENDSLLRTRRVFYFIEGFSKSYASGDEKIIKLQCRYNNVFKNIADTTLKFLSIRKMDVYLSGMGLSLKNVKDTLLPNISFMTGYGSPTYSALRNGGIKLPTEEECRDFTVPDSIKYTNRGDRICYWMFRILLNGGYQIHTLLAKELDIEFRKEIESSNNYKEWSVVMDMGSERKFYYLEFIKRLLEFWSGIGYIDSTRTYVINVGSYFTRQLPISHTCTRVLDITREYADIPEGVDKPPPLIEFYTDLVTSILSAGKSFSLVGGKRNTKNKIKKLKAKQ